MPRKSPPAPESLRKVVSTVTDGILVHFHLACGHLVTQHKNDFIGTMPTEIDCWACTEENNET